MHIRMLRYHGGHVWVLYMLFVYHVIIVLKLKGYKYAVWALWEIHIEGPQP